MTHAAEWIYATAAFRALPKPLNRTTITCVEHYPREFPGDPEEHFDLVLADNLHNAYCDSRKYGQAIRFKSVSWRPLYCAELEALTAGRYSCDYYDRIRPRGYLTLPGVVIDTRGGL